MAVAGTADMDAGSEGVFPVPTGGLFVFNDLSNLNIATFKWPALVALAAHLLYSLVVANVGRARYKYRIFPPKTAGNPDFDRIFRVQQNFSEQFPSFALGLVVCAVLASGDIAGLLGAIWVVFRAMYSVKYALHSFNLGIYLFTVPQYFALLFMYLLPAYRVLSHDP